MRVLSVIHGPDGHAGVFGDVVREAGHELEEACYALEQPPAHALGEYDAAMVFGGSMNTHEEDSHPWLRPEKAAIGELLDAGAPLLGVCLGCQLIADAAGGTVIRVSTPEIGWYDVELTEAGSRDPVFGTLPERFPSYQWHSYAVTLPEGAAVVARSPVCIQGYRLGESVWGMQFHAEVTQAMAEVWISHWERDPAAVAAAFDPDAAKAELARRVGEWNRIGRALAGAWLAHAETVAGVSAGRAATA
ncbi:MAG TPA: type 1 glutamine amidotransferase [Gaiellaceae bacterium]